MKKLKIIAILVLILLISVMLLGNCKKTNALTSEFMLENATIASQDQSQYGIVAIYSLGNNATETNNDMFYVGNLYFVNVYDSDAQNANRLTIYSIQPTITAVETYTLTSRIIQVQVVEDAGGLFLIIYELTFSLQQYQGNPPSIDGITRTMLTRFNLGTTVYDNWDNSGLNIRLMSGSQTYLAPCLFNYSYITYTENNNPTTINNWVNLQLSNYLTYNTIVESAYYYGSTDGYNAGYSQGYDTGATDGYDDGYESGKDDGYDIGYRDGEDDGYHEGYDVGYADGQAGETAISPVFNIISNVFTAIGSIMAIQLVPHVPLGLFILVPLFFSALGLILWIWRRN